MADKGGVGPEPEKSEKLSQTAEHETEVQNEAVTSASSATSQMSASISPSPAADRASPDVTSTLLGARRSFSEISQQSLECHVAFSESDSTEAARIREASGLLLKVTCSSPKATGSPPKAAGSTPKATGSSPKATVSFPQAIVSSREATASSPNSRVSSRKATCSLPKATGSLPKITCPTLMSTGTKPISTGTTPKACAPPISTGSTPKASAPPISTGSTPKASAPPIYTSSTPKVSAPPISTGSTPNAGSSPMSTGTTPNAGSWPMSTGTTPKAGSSPMSTYRSPKATGTSSPSISTAVSTGAIPRTQVAATKVDQSRMPLIGAAKEKDIKSRKISKETRSRSRNGSLSDSTPQEDITPSTGFRTTPTDSITIERTLNLLIVPMELCEPVQKLPVPSKTLTAKIIVIGMVSEIEQYVTVLYKELPIRKKSPVLYFLFPVPDRSVLASVSRNIELLKIYTKTEEIVNSIRTVTLRDKHAIRDITLDIYVDSFVAATVPQPVLPEFQRECLARICSLRPDKESCTIQLYPAYVDIMTCVMDHFMNKALLNDPDVLPVTNPIPGEVYIYINNNTRSVFRVTLIDIEFHDGKLPVDLVPTCSDQARGPEDSGFSLEQTGISPENLPIPSENSRVTCEGETGESEDRNGSDLSHESIKPEERVFKVKCIDYGLERDAEAGNIFKFDSSSHLLPLKSIPPQGLETNVFEVGTTQDGLESLLNYVVRRLVNIGVVDHGAVGFLPFVKVFNYVAQEHHVVFP